MNLRNVVLEFPLPQFVRWRPLQMVLRMGQLKMELLLLLLPLQNLVNLESLLADEMRSLDGKMSTATIAGIFVVNTSWTRVREAEMSQLGTSEFMITVAAGRRRGHSRRGGCKAWPQRNFLNNGSRRTAHVVMLESEQGEKRSVHVRCHVMIM
jgi:hypothetical protein